MENGDSHTPKRKLKKKKTDVEAALDSLLYSCGITTSDFDMREHDVIASVHIQANLMYNYRLKWLIIRLVLNLSASIVLQRMELLRGIGFIPSAEACVTESSG